MSPPLIGIGMQPTAGEGGVRTEASTLSTQENHTDEKAIPFIRYDIPELVQQVVYPLESASLIENDAQPVKHV